MCKEEPRFWDPIVYAHTGTYTLVLVPYPGSLRQLTRPTTVLDFTADGAATALESFLGSRPDLRSKKMSIVKYAR